MTRTAQPLILVALCWTVQAAPVRTVDGDTFDAMVKVWLGWGNQAIAWPERIRPLGVNTPERGKPGYQEAKVFTDAWLRQGDVTITTCERDFNGRLLARVTRGMEDLAELLIAAELGVRN